MTNNGEYFIPINEVVKRLDVPAYTLRYWEKQFPGAIRPVTGAGNRRYYRGDTVEKIATIKSLLYDKGMTIAGVKKILHNGTFNAEKNIAKTPVNTGKKDVEISALDMGDIESAIKLLNQAKSFLE
ncbi:MAG: MerR family transcriptional regulator [Alphaproteobacteria bacterium]|nr:MerR family transcriptional regulator [Alphaproteobacteria bacterium]